MGLAGVTLHLGLGTLKALASWPRPKSWGNPRKKERKELDLEPRTFLRAKALRDYSKGKGDYAWLSSDNVAEWGPSALAYALRAPSLTPTHDRACGESQLELGRWGQVEGGKQLPGAQQALGRCRSLAPSFLRPSGPATHPGQPDSHPWPPHTRPGPHSPLSGPKFFQVAPPSPSRPFQVPHFSLV